MKNIISILLVGFLALSCSSHSQKSEEKPCDQSTPKGAVMAGDFPDPSVIMVDKTYWAAATSSAWLPAYPILRSDDLVNWKVVSSVFPTRPAWTDGNYWAPEITKMDNTFYVYFAAKSKQNGRMCLGVGTSAKVEGPYQDHGPLICQTAGSIDAMPVVDEQGQKWIFWKEDGNSMKMPTPIWLSKLSSDGTKLVGKKVEVMRNDAFWEGHLIEGAYVKKHGDYWYMFYAAHACCTRECNYAVGVARSKTLQGPWEKNPANPIIKGNDEWTCPGHGSIVTDTNGRDFFLYHSYHVRDSVYVGRQAMLDEVQWQADGWPTFNNGKGPGFGFAGMKAKNAEHYFGDDFNAAKIAPEWQWPHQNIPSFTVNEGNLKITSKGPDRDPLSAFIAKPTTLGHYTATAVVNTSSLDKGARAGIAAVGNMNNALGISVLDQRLIIWTRKNGKHDDIWSFDLLPGDIVQLKMVAHHGNSFSFYQSTDGKNWSLVGNPINGEHLPPWDLGIRVALTAGGTKGSVATFESFQMEPIHE
jgi:beta-xylosidase